MNAYNMAASSMNSKHRRFYFISIHTYVCMYIPMYIFSNKLAGILTSHFKCQSIYASINTKRNFIFSSLFLLLFSLFLFLGHRRRRDDVVKVRANIKKQILFTIKYMCIVLICMYVCDIEVSAMEGE